MIGRAGIVLRRAALAIAAALWVQAASADSAQRYVAQGIAIDLDVTGPDGARAGEDVRVSLHLSDAVAGAPLVTVKPAAWLSLNRRGVPTDDRTCTRKVSAFLGSNPLARPEVDLTGFTLLALNRDPSITVIDPQSGYNGSRTITELGLDSPGADWAVGVDPPRLYVAEPLARRLAVIDTERWRRTGDIALADSPGQVLLQHDGRTLWIAAARDGTIVALDTNRMTVAARIATGRGSHRLAVTGDDRFLLVTNHDDGTVSVINIAALTKARDIPVGTAPGSLAVSALASAAYVAVDGAIAVVDPARDTPLARIEGVADVTALGITPDGRWGFAASPKWDRVTIFDTVTNRVAQTVTVADRPYEIGFTDTQAYVRRRNSEVVTLIPLAPLRADGRTAGLAEFPAGEKPPTADADGMVSAASMVASPGEAAMLLAGTAEHAVYYYREGMAAPADSFDDFGHVPAAVTIVDHSLRQTAPGTYSVVVRPPRAGSYDLAVLLDSPRIAHCFALDVAARPGDLAGNLAIEPVALPRVVPAGSVVALRFRVTQRSAEKPMPALDAITVLAILAPGSWHQRVPMVRAEDGSWGMQFIPPHAGIYLLAFEAPRLGVDVNTSPHFTIEATEPTQQQARHE